MAMHGQVVYQNQGEITDENDLPGPQQTDRGNAVGGHGISVPGAPGSSEQRSHIVSPGNNSATQNPDDVDLSKPGWNGASNGGAVAVSTDFRFFAEANYTGSSVEVVVFLLNGGTVLRSLSFSPPNKQKFSVTMLNFSGGGDILIGCLKEEKSVESAGGESVGESAVVSGSLRLVVWSVITGDIIREVTQDEVARTPMYPKATQDEVARTPMYPKAKVRGAPGLEDPPMIANATKLLRKQSAAEMFSVDEESLTLVVFGKEGDGTGREKKVVTDSESLPSVRDLLSREHAEKKEGRFKILQRTLKLKSEGHDSFWEKFRIVATFNDRDVSTTTAERENTHGAAMIASVSEDKTKIYCLLQSPGTESPPFTHTLAVFSLTAMTDLRVTVADPRPGKESVQKTVQANDAGESVKITLSELLQESLPFTLEPFIYKRDSDWKKQPVSLLRHRVGNEGRSWIGLVSGKISKEYDASSLAQDIFQDLLLEHSKGQQYALEPWKWKGCEFDTQKKPNSDTNVQEREDEKKPNSDTKSQEREGVVAQVFNWRNLQSTLEGKISISSADSLSSYDPRNAGSSEDKWKDYMMYVPNENTVLVWNYKGELLHTFPHERPVTCIDISKDGSVMVVGISGFERGREQAEEVCKGISKIILYSLHTFAELHSFPLLGDVKKAELVIESEDRCIDVTFDESAVVQQSSVRIDLDEWLDHDDGHSIGQLEGKDHLAFTSDGHFYVAVENLSPAKNSATEAMTNSATEATTILGRVPQLTFGCVKQTSHGEPRAVWLVPTAVKAKVETPILSCSRVTSFEAWSDQAFADLPLSFQAFQQAEPETEVTVTSVCMSTWGTTFGVGLMVVRNAVELASQSDYRLEAQQLPENGDPGQQPPETSVPGKALERPRHRQYFIAVFSGTFDSKNPKPQPEKPLVVVELDQPPRAMCISQELVSVLTDNAQEASYMDRECVLRTFDLFTGLETHVVRNRVSGRTLAIADVGQTRIQQRADHRIAVEGFESGEEFTLLQDAMLQFKGTDALGKLMLLQTGDEKKLRLKNLDNVDKFGPSKSTTDMWWKDKDLEVVQRTLARYKHGLSHWPLLFTEQWSEFFSNLLDVCTKSRDYGSIKLLIECCPCFWASTRYRKARLKASSTLLVTRCSTKASEKELEKKLRSWLAVVVKPRTLTDSDTVLSETQKSTQTWKIDYEVELEIKQKEGVAKVTEEDVAKVFKAFADSLAKITCDSLAKITGKLREDPRIRSSESAEAFDWNSLDVHTSDNGAKMLRFTVTIQLGKVPWDPNVVKILQKRVADMKVTKECVLVEVRELGRADDKKIADVEIEISGFDGKNTAEDAFEFIQADLTFIPRHDQDLRGFASRFKRGKGDRFHCDVNSEHSVKPMPTKDGKFKLTASTLLVSWEKRELPVDVVTEVLNAEVTSVFASDGTFKTTTWADGTFKTTTRAVDSEGPPLRKLVYSVINFSSQDEASMAIAKITKEHQLRKYLQLENAAEDSKNNILSPFDTLGVPDVLSTKEEKITDPEKAEDSGTTFWTHALATNDKTLVQILLDGVIKMVNETPEIVPVQAMQQVTDFIRASIEQNRMSDKVEAFLANLPLLNVKNKTISGHDEQVVTEFPDGDVIKTAWRTRDAPTSATAWSYLVDSDEQEEESRGDLGYRYVSVLPGLTEKRVIAAFVSDKASPTLVDNETMRATIDSLEETTAGSIWFFVWKKKGFPVGIGSWPWDWTLFLYLVTLLCFCILIFFTAIKRPTESFDTLKDTATGAFGVAMGVLAVIGHITFLVFEVVELLTVTHRKDDPLYIKAFAYVKHLTSAWNLIPIVGNTLGIITYFVTVGSPDALAGSRRDEFIRILAAFAMIFLWLNLFNYLRAYRKGSALVQMLLQIMKDMLYFVGVVLILICAFAGGFYALHGKLDPEEIGLENENACIDEPDNNEFLEVGDAIARTFLMSILGDFDVDALRNRLDVKKENDGGTRGGLLTNISFLFFFTLVLLISVVALNALIALMGSTYGRVEQSSQAVTYKAVLTITYDKLRFRYFTRWINRQTFERITRWTHVLSPSENSSMPQLLGAQSSINPVAALRKDLRQSERATQKRLDYMVESLIDVQRSTAEQGGEIATANTKLNQINTQTIELRGKTEDLSQQFDEKMENSIKDQQKQLADLLGSMTTMLQRMDWQAANFVTQKHDLDEVKSRLNTLSGGSARR